MAQVMDMWTDNLASIGTRTTGEEPGHCLIAGPGWHGTAPADPATDTTATPFDQVRLMNGPAFFQRLAAPLKDNPPRAADRPMLRRLR